MICIPCSLFELAENDRFTRKSEREDQANSNGICHRVLGSFSSAVVLKFEPWIGENSDIVLDEDEHSLLSPVVGRRQATAQDLDVLSRSMGLLDGQLSRSSSLERYRLADQGIFSLSHEWIMAVEVKDRSFRFILEENELKELKKLNPDSFKERPLSRRSSSKSPSSTRARSSSSFRRDEYFLKAALKLAEEKAQSEVKETERYRRVYKSFPAANELMIFGVLRKRSKNGFSYNERFVALAPGKLFYVHHTTNMSVGSGSSQVSLPMNGNAHSLSAHAPGTNNAVTMSAVPKVICLVPGLTWCRPPVNPTKGDVNTMFELYVSDRDDFSLGNVRGSYEVTVTKHLWACETKEERDKWMRYIQAASSVVCSRAEDSKLCSDTRSRTLSMKKNILLYFNMLRELEDKNMQVSVEWIQDQLGRSRGEVDATIKQAIADTDRDQVFVNGKDIQPCNAINVVGELCRQLSLAVPSMAEDVTLNFARLILLATTRTQSGGLIFEALDLILRAENAAELVTLVPVQEKIKPIEIDVERCSSGELASRDSSDTLRFPSNNSLSLQTMIAPSSTACEKTPAGGEKVGMKRRLGHRKSASDPQFFLKLFGHGNTNTNSPATPGADTAPSPSSPRGANGLKFGFVKNKQKTMESEGLSLDQSFTGAIRVKVHAKLLMEFSLMDRFTIEQNTEQDGEGFTRSPRLATITATFTRDFCMVDDRSVAVDQGLVSFRVCNLPRFPPRHHDDPENDDDDEGSFVEHTSDDPDYLDDDEQL